MSRHDHGVRTSIARGADKNHTDNLIDIRNYDSIHGGYCRSYHYRLQP
jgi:hypothetical protein